MLCARRHIGSWVSDGEQSGSPGTAADGQAAADLLVESRVVAELVHQFGAGDDEPHPSRGRPACRWGPYSRGQPQQALEGRVDVEVADVAEHREGTRTGGLSSQADGRGHGTAPVGTGRCTSNTMLTMQHPAREHQQDRGVERDAQQQEGRRQVAEQGRAGGGRSCAVLISPVVVSMYMPAARTP